MLGGGLGLGAAAATGIVAETDAAGALSYEDMTEATALTGQYGHSGKLKPVEAVDQDMMERIKFLAGVTK